MTQKEKIEFSVIGIGVLGLMIFLPLNAQQNKKRLAAAKARLAEEAKKAEPAVAPEAVKKEDSVLGPRDEKRRERQVTLLGEPWGRDPFRPQKALPASIRSEMILRGVAILSNGQGMAVINESIVREGDEIQGHVVRKVEKDSVVLERDSREFILKLEEEGL